MNTALGAALLVAGAILLFMGFNASQSIGSEVSEAFTGTPSDRSIWLLVGGALAAVMGFVMLLRSRRT